MADVRGQRLLLLLLTQLTAGAYCLDVCDATQSCPDGYYCCSIGCCPEADRQWALAWMLVALASVLAFICVTCLTCIYICCGRRGERVIIQTPDTDRTPLHAAKRTSYGTDRHYV